jgi:hypothetical protein
MNGTAREGRKHFWSAIDAPLQARPSPWYAISPSRIVSCRKTRFTPQAFESCFHGWYIRARFIFVFFEIPIGVAAVGVYFS